MSKEIETGKSNKFDTYFMSDDMGLEDENNSIFAFGLGLHRIRAGEAIGAYISGAIPISNTNLNVYGRGELIKDEYKTGPFWSWNMAFGVGYYVSENFIPFLTVGKCFSNYSTCYFNLRHPTANDDDIDAIYYGIGTYFTEPIFKNTFEISIDWSPYKNYNGSSLYLGYAIKF